jgi:hypothetical protein
MWREIRSSIFVLMVLLAGVSLVSSETFGVRLPAITKLSQPHLYNFSKLPDQKDGLTRALLASAAVAQGPTISDAPLSSAQVGDAKAGEAFFTGRIRLANGGPPCISCHSVSGLAFPNGGTMGPDLTGVYSRFGPEGMAAALDTLFFVTMQPLYDTRPLTPIEQQNLAAFFKQTAQNHPRPGITAEFGLISVAGCAGLFVLNGFIWKKRLRGVRRDLLARARKQRG